MQAANHRPSRLNIDLSAVQFNYRQIMKHLPAQTKGVAVIKANAYGHGALAVAQALEEEVDAFAVAVSDEALELRESGIQSELIILGYTDPGDASLHADHNIGLTILSLSWLQDTYNELQTDKRLKLHLKIDTGMSRLGVRSVKEAQKIIDFIAEYSDQLILESVFTHHATADSKVSNHQKQVIIQSSLFQNYQENLDFSQLEKNPYFHQSNSALSLWYPELTLDAVRLGIAIYGINPSNSALDLPYELKPALSLESELIFVKQMMGQERISYGAAYEAKKDEWIATLPFGYADGWQRRYGQGYALVDGKRCPFVGRVCMDQCMISLPEYYPEGTQVTLVGESGQERISLESIADEVDTIAYEIACLFTDRLPRKYSS